MSDQERNRLAGYLRYSMSDAERTVLNGLISVVTADIEHDDRDLLEIRLLEAIEVLEERLSGEASCVCGVIRMCLEMKIGDHSAACAEEVAKPSTAHVYSWEDIPELVRAQFDDFAEELEQKDSFGGEMGFNDYVSLCLCLLNARLTGLEHEMCKRLRLCVMRKIELDTAYLSEEV